MLFDTKRLQPESRIPFVHGGEPLSLNHKPHASLPFTAHYCRHYRYINGVQGAPFLASTLRMSAREPPALYISPTPRLPSDPIVNPIYRRFSTRADYERRPSRVSPRRQFPLQFAPGAARSASKYNEPLRAPVYIRARRTRVS